jgi:ribosome silencing factor RsfS/YbeB/iojap
VRTRAPARPPRPRHPAAPPPRPGRAPPACDGAACRRSRRAQAGSHDRKGRRRAKPRATTATVRAAPTAKPATPRKPAAPKRARATKQDPGRLERLVEAARKSLDDDKAEDIVVLDVTNRASYADRLIIATGFVGRQIEAMASHVDDALAKEGMKLRRSAFSKSEEWVLIDAGDLVIHLFTPEARLKFDLEKMWGPDSPMGEAAPGEQSPI